MKLLYEDKEYYFGLYDKVCDMPIGETLLTHRDDGSRDKFENHIKHWISCDEFMSHGFYLEFSDGYDKLIKKQHFGFKDVPAAIEDKPKVVKAHLTRRCKELLKNNPPGTKFEGETFEFLLSVFEGHHAWGIKKGCGVAAIGVQKSHKGSKCFNIHRTDGSVTDISYPQAISGKKPSEIKNIIYALRHAIDSVTLAFKMTIDFSTAVCFLSGEKLTPENCEIHHYDKEFSELADEFISKYGLEYLSSKINDQEIDGTVSVYFTDEALIAEFIEFHNANTHLTGVTRKANQLAEAERVKKLRDAKDTTP